MARLVAIVLALALGVSGLAATSGAASASSGAAKHRAAAAASGAAKHRAAAAASGAAKHRAATAAKRAKSATCTKRQRVRLRRCRLSHKMSAKRLSPLKGLTSTAGPAGGMPVTTTPSAPVTTTPGAPVPPPPPAPPVVSTVGANAYDMGGFVLRLTKTTVPAGNLTVFFTNHDVSDHNLWIESPSGGLERISDAVGENASANKTVAVTAGTWRLFCSLPEHEAMTRDLTVTP